MFTCDTMWSLTIPSVTINQYHTNHRVQATHAIVWNTQDIHVGIETNIFDTKDGHIILISTSFIRLKG